MCVRLRADEGLRPTSKTMTLASTVAPVDIMYMYIYFMGILGSYWNESDEIELHIHITYMYTHACVWLD